MPSNFGTLNTVTPPRSMVTKAAWSTSPDTQESELDNSAIEVEGGRAVIVTGRNVTKFSKHYTGSIRRKLRGLHSAIQNVEALAALYTGNSKKAPFDLPQKLERVFDESCTALTASLRNPSTQGVEEWSLSTLCEELKKQFAQGFKWEVVNIEVLNPPNEITYEIRAQSEDTDVTFIDIAIVKDGLITRVERQRTLYSLTPVKKCLESYFALFNGVTEAPKNFRKAFDSVYDPSAISISSKGYISCDLMYESCLMLFERGAEMKLTSIEAHERGISYTVSCKGRGLDFTSQSMAVVEQGRVVKVESLRKKKYSTRMKPEQDEEKTTQEAMENIKSLFSLFTGMRKVPQEYYEVFGDVFDASVEADIPSFESGEEFEGLNFFQLQEELMTTFRMGLTMDLVEIERRAPGKVLYTVQAYNRSTQMIFRTLVRVKSGKVANVMRKGTYFSVLPLMRAFREYVALFAGEKMYPDDWKDRLDAIVNKDEICVETGTMVINYHRICSTVEHLLQSQAKIRVDSLSRHSRGIFYELTYEIGEECETVCAVAIVAWGRIVQVEVLENGEFYDKLYSRISTEEDPTEEVTEVTDVV